MLSLLPLILTPETVTSVSSTGPELVKIGCSELGHVVTRVAARAFAEGEVPVGVEASWERHRVVGGEETLLKQDLSNEMCLQCVYKDYAGFDPRMQLQGKITSMNSIYCTDRGSTYLTEGVVVERAAVVLPLRRALRPTLLDVRHKADIGVREGQVGAGPIHVLAVVRNCGK